MNEIRSTHLVERAAMQLRGGLGLTEPAPPGATPRLTVPLPPEPAGPEPLSSPHEAVSMALLHQAGMAVGTGRRSRIAEEFSVAAGNLLRTLRAIELDPAAGAAARAGAFANLLMVTSAKPGEGKSFTALNLAATLAHNGLARVVLADIDPKPGSVTALLGLQNRPGLLELAADAALRPESVLAATAVRDLSLLPMGSRELAGGHGLARRMAVAIERLARACPRHVVILDAPPCLATSEPSALAPMMALVAVVVEAERTQREEVEHALELVRTCPGLMLLLNKIRGASGHAFGAYDYYGA